jgi:Domain of unknown function (DUF892)
MSGLDSLHALLQEELKDIWDAEKQLTKALPRLAKKASAAELKRAFDDQDRWRFPYGEIREEGISEGRAGHARAQAGHAALGGVRQEGHEP